MGFHNAAESLRRSLSAPGSADCVGEGKNKPQLRTRGTTYTKKPVVVRHDRPKEAKT